MLHPRIAASLALTSFLGCAAVFGVTIDALAPQQAKAQEIDEGYFYTSLAPHGQWVNNVEFGWIWHPTHVPAGWRPYTEGHWVWADEVGWVWMSYEPWGWATYHYGRWYFDPYYGWSWVPGRVWAPAWVSWRIEDGYVGWAPLWPVYFDTHPDWDRDHHRHDRDWDRRHHGRDWDRWVFTRDRDFTSPHVGRRAIVDRRERDRILERSRDITQFDGNDPGRIGRSLDKRVIEKALGKPIRPVKIEASDKPGRSDQSQRDRVRVFQPRVKEKPDVTPERLGVAKQPGKEERDRQRQAWEGAKEERGASDNAKQGGSSERGGGPGGLTGRDANRDQGTLGGDTGGRPPTDRPHSPVDREANSPGREMRNPASAEPQTKMPSPERHVAPSPPADAVGTPPRSHNVPVERPAYPTRDPAQPVPPRVPSLHPEPSIESQPQHSAPPPREVVPKGQPQSNRGGGPQADPPGAVGGPAMP